MVLQKQFRSSETLSGMWQNINPINPSDKLQWSTHRNDILAGSAKQAKSPLEHDDIAVTDSVEGSNLWVWTGDGWRWIGKVDIILSGSTGFRWIRGIRVHPSVVSDAIVDSLLLEENPEISKLVASNLARIQHLAASCTAVECSLTLDAENYVVTLHSPETEGDVVFETLVFERTKELVDFLRLPLTSGESVEVHSQKNNQYTWNPYIDIHYGTLDIMRPYVERRKPFVSTKIMLPATAQELIKSEAVSVKFRIKHDVHQCPIWLGIGDDHASCWIFESKDFDVPNGVSSILNAGLTDTEISEIMKSKEIHLNGTRYEVNIEFPSEEDYEKRLVFRESRLFAWHLGARTIQPSSFLRTDEERFYCDLFKEDDSIHMKLISDLTEDVIYSGLLVHLFKGMETQQAFDHANQVFVDIFSDRFAKETPEKKIKSFDKLNDNLLELIKKYT